MYIKISDKKLEDIMVDRNATFGIIHPTTKSQSRKNPSNNGSIEMRVLVFRKGIFRRRHNRHLTWDSHPVNVGSSIFCFLVSGSTDMVPFPSRILLAWYLIYEGWRSVRSNNLQLFEDYLTVKYFCRLAATGCSSSTWKLLTSRRFLHIIITSTLDSREPSSSLITIIRRATATSACENEVFGCCCFRY